MAYTNNIPQPNDQLSTSQPQILANFAAIDSGTTGTGTGFSRNHVTLTNGTDGGLHYRVDFEAALSAPTITGFVSSAYPKTVVVTTPSSSNVELFYKNTGSDIQLTSSALTASSGEGFIGGGLQIRSAFVGWPGQSGTISFSSRFPTACLSVVVSNANSGNNAATINVITNSATGFQVFSPNVSGGANFSYVATGY